MLSSVIKNVFSILQNLGTANIFKRFILYNFNKLYIDWKQNVAISYEYNLGTLYNNMLNQNRNEYQTYHVTTCKNT